MKKSILAGTSLSLALLAAPALAQQATQQPAEQQPAQAQPQMAEQCVQDLRAFDEEARREGYVLIGPGAAGLRPDGAAATTGTPPAAGTGAMTTTAAGRYGVSNPRRDLSVLYQAAYVFARQGDEEACQRILEETRQMFTQRMARLQEAGVSLDEVRTWRVDELAAAQPVEQIGSVRIDNVFGADVRNLQDEDLGNIDDVIFDPESGQVSHVIISHGGFLGIGEEHVAVPWEALRAAPGLDTFVLNASESAIEQAPKVDPDAFRNPEVYGERREAVDTYWKQRLQQQQ